MLRSPLQSLLRSRWRVERVKAARKCGFEASVPSALSPKFAAASRDCRVRPSHGALPGVRSDWQRSGVMPQAGIEPVATRRCRPRAAQIRQEDGPTRRARLPFATGAFSFYAAFAVGTEHEVAVKSAPIR